MCEERVTGRLDLRQAEPEGRNRLIVSPRI